MKKILIGIVALMLLLTGCRASDKATKLFVMNSQNKYALYDSTGKNLSKFIYDSYKEVGSSYLVRSNGKYGLLANDGKELIKLGKYSKLVKVATMVVAIDKDKKKTLFDQSGKELVKENKNITIKVEELPLVINAKKYIVYDYEGKKLLTSKKQINYVRRYGKSQVLVGYKKTVDLYNTAIDSQKITVKVDSDLTLDINGYQTDKGYLLADQDQGVSYFVDKKGKTTKLPGGLSSLAYDDDNITAYQEGSLVLVDYKNNKVIPVNSYFQSIDKYVVKNTINVYGPHQFTYKGKTKEVKDIQVYPTAVYSEDIFPVYVRDKGYQFYDFKGKKAFAETFLYAQGFSADQRAIVSKDEKKYYLIDNTGKKIGKSYENIIYIDNGFYAVYQDGLYSVMDKNGAIVIDEGFLGNCFIQKHKDITYGVFVKNNVSYVYNMKDYKLIFKKTGSLNLNSNGYFVTNDKSTYYTLKGEKIYKR